MESTSRYILLFIAIATTSCNDLQQQPVQTLNDTTAAVLPFSNNADSISVDTATVNPPIEGAAQPLAINTRDVDPNELVSFAETLVGIPYKYASTDPKAGFDCSGFITHVFSYFNIQVPRSSIDFTSVGETVEEGEAKRGDIILFTGTNPAERFVGHMGLITQNEPQIKFIHSSSGKAHGVTITPLNDYYRTRFVKIIRIFKQNNQ